jgi:hypothetical protein
MTTVPRRLSLASPTSQGAPECSMVCQASFSGPQQTSARVLTPVSGSEAPHIAVRVGPLLLRLNDRGALHSLIDVCGEAEGLADAAYGPVH